MADRDMLEEAIASTPQDDLVEAFDTNPTNAPSADDVGTPLLADGDNDSAVPAAETVDEEPIQEPEEVVVPQEEEEEKEESKDDNQLGMIYRIYDIGSEMPE